MGSEYVNAKLYSALSDIITANNDASGISTVSSDVINNTDSTVFAAFPTIRRRGL